MVDDARTKFEEKKAGTSSAPTSRQTRSVNVKKEKPPPPPKIQIRRKAKKDEPQAPKTPKAIEKRKREQAKIFFKAVAEEEAKETESEGGKKELRASGKKYKVVGAPTVKSVKFVQAETEEILKRFLGLEREELDMIETYEEEDILKEPVIEGELLDVFEIDEIFTQKEKEPEGGTTSVPTITKEQQVFLKVIPTGKDEEGTKTQENAQIDVEQTKKSPEKAEEKQKEEEEEQKVTA
ncbi:uncharacterized protein LOC131874246 [Cryptomeria japonica]|uniref:uncharacterized protein LOC131874246 n=1 Tax=Cryptomeria japonica TaxID=3369 RepID=UPI0027D9D34F|nr:uncharacterized protein LOC131874246 [Cryptomeria japonica]